MSKLKIAKQLPIDVLVKRVFKRVFSSQKIDYSSSDFRKSASNYKIISLLTASNFNASINQEVITHYLNHEFNLLGSGWINRNALKVLELSTEHQFFAEKLFKYISDEYSFINWQLDVKSDFEFDVKKQFDNQFIDKTKNVDIKNCWELGRLQHLPQMAIAAFNTENNEELVLEFKNQSLDFIVSNPIGMGVQWACAMDVAIRICNLLIAFDIFQQVDKTGLLDDAFKLIFTDSIHRHTEFVLDNLEHKEGAAGNHYLFNLVGILFATNYLSEKEESKEWRKFAEAEIEKEFHKQFFNDGGNFEGSTTYHCLSSEAMLYATALKLRHSSKLNQEYIDLLGKSVQFIKATIKPDGNMPQFGDNDSGRLFTINQIKDYKSLLNYESLLGGFSALYGTNEHNGLEKTIVEQLSKNKKLVLPEIKPKKKHQIRNAKHQLQKPKTTEIKFSGQINLEGIKKYAFDDFGLYVFKSDEFYMAISAISNKKMHHSWGHVHNDKLSFELQVKGKDLVKDPGTYSYSGYPEIREKLRSTQAHHSIVVKGVEQNKLLDIVYLDREVKCKVLEFQDLSITLQANYYGVEHIRKFTILSNQIIITDYCNKPFKVNINKFDEYSPNYGVLEKVNK